MFFFFECHVLLLIHIVYYYAIFLLWNSSFVMSSFLLPFVSRNILVLIAWGCSYIMLFCCDVRLLFWNQLILMPYVSFHVLFSVILALCWWQVCMFLFWCHVFVLMPCLCFDAVSLFYATFLYWCHVFFCAISLFWYNFLVLVPRLCYDILS